MSFATAAASTEVIAFTTKVRQTVVLPGVPSVGERVNPPGLIRLLAT